VWGWRWGEGEEGVYLIHLSCMCQCVEYSLGKWLCQVHVLELMFSSMCTHSRGGDLKEVGT